MPKCNAQKKVVKTHRCIKQKGHKGRHRCKCKYMFGKGEPMIELDTDVARCGVIGYYDGAHKIHVCSLPMLHHGRHKCGKPEEGMENGCGFTFKNEGEEDDDE